LQLANQGAEAAMKADPHLLNGLNVYRGKVTNLQVSEAHGMAYSAPDNLISG
jgi:alanine dehydrogenase